MKAIVVENLNRTRAELILAIKTNQSSMGAVLEQMIIVADDNGFIEQANNLFTHMEKQLNITNVNYRSIIHKLSKLKMITKIDGGFLLCKELAGKDEILAICQKEYLFKPKKS
jgi:hypothetical protein